MPIEIKLAAVGDDSQEAKVIKWHVCPGQHVREHDIVVELETDKTVIEVPAQRDGTVAALAVTEGEIVKVGAILYSLQTEETETASKSLSPKADDQSILPFRTVEVAMPRLAETMERGIVVKWYVKPGQRIRIGDVIADIETDKATMELQTFEDGVVVLLIAREGETMKVGSPILRLAAGSEAGLGVGPDLVNGTGAGTIQRPVRRESQQPRITVKQRSPMFRPEHTIADSTDVTDSRPDLGASDRTISDVEPHAQSFQLLMPIGEGGMARVYLAFDPLRKKFVAVKRLHERHVGDQRAIIRFQTEADAMRRLKHDHIVAAFEHGRDASGPYIVMEYVEGPARMGNRFPRGWQDGWPNPSMSLDELVREHGKLSPQHTVSLGVSLCQALEHAHAGPSPLYHRDIKPLNIMFLRTVDHPKLVDFGLVKQRDGREIASTMVGGRMGSEGYMSPEQETDASNADHRSDIYSLARTLWFAATGDRPQDFIHSKIDEPLRTVLLKASDTSRERRYQSATEFKKALKGESPSPQSIELVLEKYPTGHVKRPAEHVPVITRPQSLIAKPSASPKPSARVKPIAAAKPITVPTASTSTKSEVWGCVGGLVLLCVYGFLLYMWAGPVIVITIILVMIIGAINK